MIDLAPNSLPNTNLPSRGNILSPSWLENSDQLHDVALGGFGFFRKPKYETNTEL